ncbi:hypothetical protein MPER_12972, partial [Moniliophthora perniciosa FA553]
TVGVPSIYRLRLTYPGDARIGVIYFVLMFMLSVINILVMTVLPPDYTFILGPFERVLHCILTSRMIIHIRQVASRNHSTCS